MFFGFSDLSITQYNNLYYCSLYEHCFLVEGGNKWIK
jgi:hypothetical protein